LAKFGGSILTVCRNRRSSSSSTTDPEDDEVDEVEVVVVEVVVAAAAVLGVTAAAAAAAAVVAAVLSHIVVVVRERWQQQQKQSQRQCRWRNMTLKLYRSSSPLLSPCSSLPSTLPSHPRPSLLASIHPTLTHPNLQAVPRAPAMSASSIIGSFFEQYRKTSQLARIVDQFIVFAFLTSVVQMVYVIMVGTFPFNSFLAGFISSLGTMVLLGVLVVFDTAVA
jgi:hypothetical protein